MDESILVVDDEEAVCEVITRALLQRGFRCRQAASADMAMELLGKDKFALVLADIRMAGHDGVWLLHKVVEKFSNTAVIMVTALGDIDTAIHCLTQGADNYLVKPVDVEELTQACRRALKRRRLLLENREYQEDLERRLGEQGAQLRDAMRELERADRMVKDAQRETVHRLAAAAEFRDEDTGGHLRRISSYAAAFSCRLGLPSEEVALIEEASPMHDIGKIAVPDAILLKPGRLTAEEFEIVKRHALIGAEILSDPTSSLLLMAETVARTHHERWDGKGYPYGLTGLDIPRVGRIVALADVFDALTSKRCYKEAVSVEEAVRIIRGESGRHFDPEVVRAFLASLGEVRAIYHGTKLQRR